MEMAATPEAPRSNAQVPKKSRKLRVVAGLAVIIVGLLGFWEFMAARGPTAISVSVTFLGYTNVDTLGTTRDYRLAWFRITNKSQFQLLCTDGMVEIESAGRWIRETDSAWRLYNPPTLAPGQSTMVSVITPSKGTRWRNDFLMTTLDSPDPPWKRVVIRLMVRLPSQNLRTRVLQWLYSHPPSRYVTSETLKL
jgi:hypothetical protein